MTAIIKTWLIVALFLNASPSNRIEETTALFNGQAVKYYTAYNNGECVADDVPNIKTLAELLTAPHGVRISAENIAEYTKG